MSASEVNGNAPPYPSSRFAVRLQRRWRAESINFLSPPIVAAMLTCIFESR